jgi:hypothetical protein
MSFQRTGRLKGVEWDGDIVGFVLVDMRKDELFPNGISDVVMDRSFVPIAKTWMGKRVKVEGVVRKGEIVNSVDCYAIGLAN